jgi:signal transduction histidine kinase
MWLYEFMERLGLRRSYVAKVMLVSFLGVHVPLIVLIAYVLMRSDITLVQSLPVLLVVLVATLVGTGATLAALWFLLAPLRRASDTIHTYLSRRQIVPLPTRYEDEAGRLMADIQEGITRLDAALDSAQSAARRSEDERYDQFEMLSRMSHELRTPLNIIIGFSEMIQSQIMGPLGTRVYGDYAADIRSSGLDLLERVNALLELSATKAGAFEGDQHSRLDLGEVLETVKGLQHLHGERRGVEVRLIEPAEQLWVEAEPRALKQVLLHAVQGAIAGSKSGDYVLITANRSKAGSGVDLLVSVPQAPFIADDVPRPLEAYFDGALEKPVSAGDDVTRQTSAQGFSLSVAAAIALTQKIGLKLTNSKGGGRLIHMSFA